MATGEKATSGKSDLWGSLFPAIPAKKACCVIRSKPFNHFIVFLGQPYFLYPLWSGKSHIFTLLQIMRFITDCLLSVFFSLSAD